MITKIKGNLTRDYFKNYYQRNKDFILNKQKQYYYDNRDSVLEYRHSIKDKINLYQKEYHNKNINNPNYLKQRKAIHQRHYKKNKDKIAVKNKKYYQNVIKPKRELNKVYSDLDKLYHQNYYNDNREEIRQKQREYYKQNKQKYIDKYKEKVKNGGKGIKLYSHNGFNKRNKWIKGSPKPSTYNFTDDGKVILSFS
jgi:hypothetical protein